MRAITAGLHHRAGIPPRDRARYRRWWSERAALLASNFD